MSQTEETGIRVFVVNHLSLVCRYALVWNVRLWLIYKRHENLPKSAQGRPRAAVFVLACTNWTFVRTEAALEQHERHGSVAPHMPEMEAEVTAAAVNQSLTLIEGGHNYLNRSLLESKMPGFHCCGVVRLAVMMVIDHPSSTSPWSCIIASIPEIFDTQL